MRGQEGGSIPLTHEGGQGGDVGAELRERRDPELLADHRRALGRDALARGKLLEPGCKEGLDRRRDADVTVAAVL